MPIIETKNLTYIYGQGTPFEKVAVEGVSLSVEKGEFIGVIGHTGSGKSTLIQTLNGLIRPTSGQVLLDGRDIWQEPKKIRSVRFRVGMVFQYPEYQLFEERRGSGHMRPHGLQVLKRSYSQNPPSSSRAGRSGGRLSRG